MHTFSRTPRSTACIHTLLQWVLRYIFLIPWTTKPNLGFPLCASGRHSNPFQLGRFNLLYIVSRERMKWKKRKKLGRPKWETYFVAIDLFFSHSTIRAANCVERIGRIIWNDTSELNIEIEEKKQTFSNCYKKIPKYLPLPMEQPSTTPKLTSFFRCLWIWFALPMSKQLTKILYFIPRLSPGIYMKFSNLQIIARNRDIR